MPHTHALQPQSPRWITPRQVLYNCSYDASRIKPTTQPTHKSHLDGFFLLPCCSFFICTPIRHHPTPFPGFTPKINYLPMKALAVWAVLFVLALYSTGISARQEHTGSKTVRGLNAFRASPDPLHHDSVESVATFWKSERTLHRNIWAFSSNRTGEARSQFHENVEILIQIGSLPWRTLRNSRTLTLFSISLITGEESRGGGGGSIEKRPSFCSAVGAIYPLYVLIW